MIAVQPTIATLTSEEIDHYRGDVRQMLIAQGEGQQAVTDEMIVQILTATGGDEVYFPGGQGGDVVVETWNSKN